MSKFVLFVIILLIPFLNYAQKKDTIYIKFNQEHKEMRKEDFTNAVQAGSSDEMLGKSITYYIRQKEKPSWSGNEFSFTHANHPKKAYEKFGGAPPLISRKERSYLEDKKVLDIQFFRKTPYIEVCKTFEEEDSWEEDVIIFMVDVDEMKNDSIVLRQVDFSRPVKE